MMSYDPWQIDADILTECSFVLYKKIHWWPFGTKFQMSFPFVIWRYLFCHLCVSEAVHWVFWYDADLIWAGRIHWHRADCRRMSFHRSGPVNTLRFQIIFRVRALCSAESVQLNKKRAGAADVGILLLRNTLRLVRLFTIPIAQLAFVVGIWSSERCGMLYASANEFQYFWSALLALFL